MNRAHMSVCAPRSERSARVSGQSSELVGSAARPWHEGEPSKRNRTSAALAQAVSARLKFLQSAQHFTQKGLLEGNEGNVPITNDVALTLESQLECCQLLIAQVHCLAPGRSRLTLV